MRKFIFVIILLGASFASAEDFECQFIYQRQPGQVAKGNKVVTEDIAGWIQKDDKFSVDVNILRDKKTTKIETIISEVDRGVISESITNLGSKSYFEDLGSQFSYSLSCNN